MSYEAYLDGEPMIVTAALTGGIHGKEANPNLPETPDEIGDAAAEAVEAGASIVHVHAREPSGERSFATEDFQAIDDAINARVDDVIIQHSTGGTGAPLDHRTQPLYTDPPPEMASLDMGPMNRYRHLTSENTRATVDALYDEMASRDIKPELEAFNDGHINEIFGLLERRSLAEPVHTSVIFGPGTLSPPHPRNLLSAMDNLPDGTSISTIAFGRHQLPLTTMAMLLGGHVRVGLEDNVYLSAGQLAQSNAELVERAVAIAEMVNRPVATVEQTRELLGLAQ